MFTSIPYMDKPPLSLISTALEGSAFNFFTIFSALAALPTKSACLQCWPLGHGKNLKGTGFVSGNQERERAQPGSRQDVKIYMSSPKEWSARDDASHMHNQLIPLSRRKDMRIGQICDCRCTAKRNMCTHCMDRAAWLE